MHILLVADSDEKYGASQSMKQLADRLLKYDKDMQISVVLPLRNHSEEYYQRLGCPTYKILYEPFCQNILEQKWKRPLKFLVRGAEYLFGKYFGVSCLSRRLDMDSIDLIHSNSSREDFSAALALKYKKPLVWHIRELGEHCFSFRKDYISLMNQAATQFIAVSETVKERWIKKGLQEEKIVRIYNGVDSKVSRKETYETDRSHKMRLLMIGAVYEAKGQWQAVQACGLLTQEERKSIALDIIGGGSPMYMGRLKNMIEEYGLEDTVRLLGYRENAGGNIACYDCGLMCSKSEGFGKVTAEYMMAGLPVVASDIPTNTELVANGVNGWLYRQGDASDLKEKMVYLLNHRELLEEAGRRAGEYARSHFTAERNAELIYKEYVKIGKRGNSGSQWKK